MIRGFWPGFARFSLGLKRRDVIIKYALEENKDGRHLHPICNIHHCNAYKGEHLCCYTANHNPPLILIITVFRVS